MKLNRMLIMVNIRYLLRDPGNRVLVLCLLVLVVTAGFLRVMVLSPAINDHTSKTEELVRLERMVMENRQYELAVSQYNKASRVIDEIDEKLMSRFGQAELTRRFNTLAAENGVKVLHMSTKNGRSGPGYRSYVNEIALSASYPSVRDLLLAVRDLPGVNLVNEISMAKERDEDGIKVMMTLVTFRSEG